MSYATRVIACSCLTGLLIVNQPGFCAERSPKDRSENGAAERKKENKAIRQGSEKTPQQQPSGQKNGKEATPTVGSASKIPEEIKSLRIESIFDQPGVLTPSRTLVVEPSIQYINSSSNRVALSGYTVIPSVTIGLIDVRNITSNTYVAALSTRYGLTNRLECELKVPYVYRSDSTASQPANTQDQSIPASVFVADGHGIGDVEVGARYQLNTPKPEGPYFITGLRLKTVTGKNPFEVRTDPNVKGPGGEPLQTELPTGSGFWALQPSITAIFASDPVAFFGTISYMWNMKRSFAGVNYDPGDTFGFNLGAGIALNEKTSLSFGYDHVVLGKTKRNGEDLPGTLVTHIGTLLIGCSYKLNEKTNLNFSLGTGVTPAASNVQLTLRVPVSFGFGR